MNKMLNNNITSTVNSKIKFVASLKTSKGRKENHLFVVEGIKTIELAIKAGAVKEIYTINRLSNIPENIPQFIINQQVLEKITYSKNPEGVVAVCHYLNVNKNISADKYIYMDHIQDPGNLGTIIRTALAFNYDGIVLSSDCASIYNEKVVAASKGAIFLIPIIDATLKDFSRTHSIICTSLDDDSVDVKNIKLPKKYVLVLGNEAHGISQDSLNLCNIKTKIDISNIDSLNVSIAAGIFMYLLK